MGRYKKILVQPQRKPTTASLSNKSQRKKKYFSYTPTTTISDLPNEMLLYILALLPQEVILSKINLVCKRWNQLTKCASFWKRVVLNDKMSRRSINRSISMAPQLKHLVVQHRDDLSAILNRVSQNCKHLETLEVYNCVGSSKSLMVNSLPMSNLISRCSKLHDIQFHQTAMATTSNVFILCILLVVLLFLTSVHTKRINRQQFRPTRGFQEMELGVSRGFGKRAVDMHIINKAKSPPDIEWVGRQPRGFQEMNIPVARGFGKRTVDMHVIKNFLLEWFALETKMRSLRNAQLQNGLPPPLNE